MKQPQYSPMSVAEQALTLFGVNKGYFDDVEVKRALAFEAALRSHVKSKYKDLFDRIETTEGHVRRRREGARRRDRGLQEERRVLSPLHPSHR